MIKIISSFAFLFLFVQFTLPQEKDVTLNTVADYNGWGKTALVIDNGYIQLVIIPEIGARVLQYGFADDEYMAINEPVMNNNYNPESDQTGPWNSWGYGGYKVWPAPQSFWGWPPPPYLDWADYTYSIEHESADSVIIYTRSEVESFKTPGLQQARRYKIYKNTTKVIVEQILINVSSTSTEWSIWEVTQAIKSHNNSGDFQNISTYFPSDAASIKTLVSPKLNTTEVNENVRKFNANGSNQKIGTLLKEGWICFVDERDEQAYAKVFDIFPETEQYPDQNSNFQIYVGGQYIEIEVLGPLTEIAQGDSISYTEEWYAAHLKGSILTTNNAGAVREHLSTNSDFSSMYGEFGIFNSGSVKLHYYDALGAELGISSEIAVEAAQKLQLSENVIMPEGTSGIKLVAYDLENKFIGVIDSCSKTDINAIKQVYTKNDLLIYPNNCSPGETVYISTDGKFTGAYEVTLISMNGSFIYKLNNLSTSYNKIEFTVPEIVPGIYLLQLRSNDRVVQNKLTIN